MVEEGQSPRSILPAKVQLRNIRASDHANLLRLWSHCEDVQPRLLSTPQALRRYLERNPDCSWLAQDDQRHVIGCILAGHDGLRGSLHHLAVHPSWRRQGIAMALAKRALAALQSQGISMSTIWIYDNNQNGQSFWQTLGYERWEHCSTWSRQHPQAAP